MILHRLLILGCVASGAACDTRRPTTDQSTSAAGPVLSSPPTECITSFRDDIDYFPHKTQLRFARGFDVTYHRYYKVVSTASRWQGQAWADTVVLLQCGAPPERLPDALTHLPIIPIPVKLAGFTEEADSARMASLPRRAQMHMLVGPRLGGRAAEVVFVSTRNVNPAMLMHQTRAGGGAAVPTQNWVESTPLARTEWVKHHALFINAEADAAAHFDSIATNYTTLSRDVGRQFRFGRVFWGGLNSSGVWQTHNRNLESRLLADAGGLNIFFEENAARFMNLSVTKLLRHAENIDVWINDGVPTTELPPDLLQRIAAVKTGRVYRYARNDRTRTPLWHTAASVEPTQVLAEMISLVHDPARTSGLRYFVPDLP